MLWHAQRLPANQNQNQGSDQRVKKIGITFSQMSYSCFSATGKKKVIIRLIWGLFIRLLSHSSNYPDHQMTWSSTNITQNIYILYRHHTFCPITPFWHAPHRNVNFDVSVNFLFLQHEDYIINAQSSSRWKMYVIRSFRQTYGHHKQVLQLVLQPRQYFCPSQQKRLSDQLLLVRLEKDSSTKKNC